MTKDEFKAKVLTSLRLDGIDSLEAETDILLDGAIAELGRRGCPPPWSTSFILVDEAKEEYENGYVIGGRYIVWRDLNKGVIDDKTETLIDTIADESRLLV